MSAIAQNSQCGVYTGYKLRKPLRETPDDAHSESLFARINWLGAAAANIDTLRACT